MSFLDLSNNKIHGVVPNWIWNAGSGIIVHLNLSCNFLDHLEEPLPDPNSRSSAIVDHHSNLLQGPVPILSSVVTYLDYSNNNFTSTIPANISSYLSFTIFFFVSNNKLHREIPTSICNASNHQVLNLSNNNLSNMVPTCLGSNTRTLGVLNLGQNNFKGSIPQTFPIGCSPMTLDLNGNELEGSIPMTLGNCKMLESNHFHGPIRRTDHTFPRLPTIDLSSNDFVGNLSSEVFLSWKAMTVEEDETQSENKIETLRFKFLEFYQVYYQDTVMLTNKGIEIELVKILTIFTSIDLSNNKFQG
ncbi:PREDICTED: receptor-like protein 12 [Nelumbo nucifera]|uniref:Receptor-like protein 12 n=1 Tax=Nelumbo nucifera TaxID=4432 RepID=A0A1U8B988_NELNU|nr:PREDICTED: receptor-like protein 12 [Nelumbo nucifera]